MPSCTKCNTVSGKGTQFPIGGQRICAPTPLLSFFQMKQLEDPLLIHPYLDEPEKHLCFLPDGSVVGLDDYGKTSIEIYDLKREKLCEARRVAINHAKFEFAVRQGPLLGTQDGPALQQALDQLQLELSRPSVEFFAAVRDVLRDMRTWMAPSKASVEHADTSVSGQ